MKPSEKSVLFRTCAASDVQNSGGVLSITGLFPVNKKLLKSITQVKYKAEVPQVITVGGVSTTWTPVGSTIYKIAVYDRNRINSGYQETAKYYSYTTSADLSTEGATAALQREYINGQIVTAINADATNHTVAASLGSGNGYTITDDGGYYPAHSQTQTNIKFVNEVVIISGYAKSNVAVTTAGATSVGVGATLATFAPVVDFMTGNLISGTLTAPPLTVQASGGAAGLPAVSGQNYDAWVMIELHEVPAHGEGNNKLCYINEIQTIWADNGTGSSTTNLTGYIAFERAIMRAAFELFKNDPSAIYGFFDAALIASATYPTTGVAVTTTDNVVMAVQGSQGDNWYVNPIGTHTVITPIVGTGGMNLILDATDEEGMEISAPNLTQCPKEFVVGQSEYSFYARVSATNYAHLEEFAFGLRKKAAYAVNLVAYDVASADFAAMGVVSEAVDGIFKIQTSKAAGGIVAGTTLGTFSSGAIDLMITVDINGLCAFYVNGVNKTSTQTTNYSFTAGTHLIPFIDTTLDANVDAAPLLLQAAALPSITWRIN